MFGCYSHLNVFDNAPQCAELMRRGGPPTPQNSSPKLSSQPSCFFAIPATPSNHRIVFFEGNMAFLSFFTMYLCTMYLMVCACITMVMSCVKWVFEGLQRGDGEQQHRDGNKNLQKLPLGDPIRTHIRVHWYVRLLFVVVASAEAKTIPIESNTQKYSSSSSSNSACSLPEASDGIPRFPARASNSASSATSLASAAAASGADKWQAPFGDNIKVQKTATIMHNVCVGVHFAFLGTITSSSGLQLGSTSTTLLQNGCFSTVLRCTF